MRRGVPRLRFRPVLGIMLAARGWFPMGEEPHKPGVTKGRPCHLVMVLQLSRSLSFSFSSSIARRPGSCVPKDVARLRFACPVCSVNSYDVVGVCNLVGGWHGLDALDECCKSVIKWVR